MMMESSSIADDGGVSRESWVAVLARVFREDLVERDLAGGLSGERRGLAGGEPEEVWLAVREDERAV